MPQIIRHGDLPSVAGISFSESSGAVPIRSPQFGATAVIGPFRRGPVDRLVRVRSRVEYDNLYGDPSNPTNHLYPKSEHQTPDFVDAWFAAGGSSSSLWVWRLGMDGAGRVAEKTFYGRNGSPVLRVRAANPGRWGGAG